MKTRIKKVSKQVRQLVDGGTQEDARVKLDAAKSVIDKAARKGVIHKKTASRKISRLSRKVNAIGA